MIEYICINPSFPPNPPNTRTPLSHLTAAFAPHPLSYQSPLAGDGNTGPLRSALATDWQHPGTRGYARLAAPLGDDAAVP